MTDEINLKTVGELVAILSQHPAEKPVRFIVEVNQFDGTESEPTDCLEVFEEAGALVMMPIKKGAAK